MPILKKYYGYYPFFPALFCGAVGWLAEEQQKELKKR